MTFCIIFLSVFSLAVQQQPVKQGPDYLRTVAHIYENLDSVTRKDLDNCLGGRSLQSLVTGMGKTARDSIARYAAPIEKLRFVDSYSRKEFDSVLKPFHLDIMNGINRFERYLSDPVLTRQDKIFALQVLIGLFTAKELPLQITYLQPRDEFLKHDIFFERNAHEEQRSLVANMLYPAYRLGVMVKKANGNKRMVDAFIEAGYKAAGNHFAGSLYWAFIPKGVIRIDEPPDSYALEPGKELVYNGYFAHPQFPGGLQVLEKFLNQRLIYPEEEWDKGIDGTCYISIVVEKDGSLSNIKVTHGVTPGIDSEAVRVVRMSPKWLPGHSKFNGRIVRSNSRDIRIEFRIKPGVKREDAFKDPVDNVKIKKR